VDLDVVDVDLLKEQRGARLDEGRKRPLHLQVRHHVLEFAVEAAEKGEDELLVADRIAEIAEGGSHRLEAAAVISDVEITLFEGPKLGLQEQRAGLPLSEELVLKVQPCGTSSRAAEHQGVLQIVGGGAVDPSDDAAIHGLPGRASRVRDVGEDVILKVVLAEDDQEHRSPATIIAGRLVQRHRDQDLDVVDADRLGVEVLVGGFLGSELAIEGRGSLGSLLGEARGDLLGSFRHPGGDGVCCREWGSARWCATSGGEAGAR
jgi:hypothetical protein